MGIAAIATASVFKSQPDVVVTAVETGSAPASAAIVRDQAERCGVYGLPGSPAAVVLLPGADGTPSEARVESDIFGGPDTEGCVLDGARGIALSGRPMRVDLTTFDPTSPPSDGTRPVRRAMRVANESAE
jgi:hypothetical protein